MVSIKEALQYSQTLNSDSARLDVELLLAEVLQKDRSYFYAWPERALNPEQLQRFFSLLERRKNGEPIAYILQKKEFWSMELAVDACTLIPRSDTELLVELALAFIQGVNEARILDLGTGTGAIALALAKERPHAMVEAVDHQSAAVALAKKNSSLHGIKNLRIYLSNWFERVEGRFDLIVSNPPYIDAQDHHLNQGDVKFEPRSALVSDKNGLADIEAIIQHSRGFLAGGAGLLLEHGWQQAGEVRFLLEQSGFVDIETHKDYSGHERVTGGRWFE